MLTRFARTVRHLSPVQVAHRVRLRARRLAGAVTGGGAARAGRTPPLRGPAEVPLRLLRPSDPELVAERAEAVAAGRFAFLGVVRDLGDRPFPAPADVPLLWAYHLEYMDYLLDLALTGRAEALAALVRARLDSEGRRRLSADHPYPVSRRAAAWARALATGAADGGPLREDLARGVWGWSGRVLANLELDVGGNHLLENGLALVRAGAAFRGPAARRRLEVGARILEGGAREQVRPDGAHYELSPLYHARVLSVLVEGGRVMAGAGRLPAPDYWPRVGRMVPFLRGLLDPEGQLPLFGDTVREEEVEPARLLAAVEELLPGAAGTTPVGDRLHADSGFAVFEDRAGRHRLLLDAGPTCPPRLPAHGQADTFTFELHASGRPFVVDPGVFEYAAGPMRDWCRSTRAHSTVEVGGADSSEVWGSFRIGRRARILDRRFGTDRGFGTLSAAHDGYTRFGARHERLVSHLAPGLFLVADRVPGAGGRVVTSRLNLHPEVIIERPGEREIVAHLAGARLRVVAFGPVRLSLEDGWHCPSFGTRRRTTVVRLDATVPGAAFGTVLDAGVADPVAVAAADDTIRVGRGGERFTRSFS